jgi:hypothetical protein
MLGELRDVRSVLNELGPIYTISVKSILLNGKGIQR